MRILVAVVVPFDFRAIPSAWTIDCQRMPQTRDTDARITSHMKFSDVNGRHRDARNSRMDADRGSEQCLLCLRSVVVVRAARITRCPVESPTSWHPPLET